MTLPQIDPLELSHWQGGVDEKLKGMETRLGGVEIKIDSLPGEIEKRLEKIINGTSKENNAVTFQWVLEKIALPLIVGGGSAGLTFYAVMKTLGG